MECKHNLLMKDHEYQTYACVICGDAIVDVPGDKKPPKPAPGGCGSYIAPLPPGADPSRAERQERVWWRLEYGVDFSKDMHKKAYAWASENLSANYRLGTVTDQAPLKRALKDNLRAITSEQLGELELMLGV